MVFDFYYFKNENKDSTKRYLCREKLAGNKECGASIITDGDVTHILKVRGKDFLNDQQVQQSHHHDPLTKSEIDKMLTTDIVKERARTEMVVRFFI